MTCANLENSHPLDKLVLFIDGGGRFGGFDCGIPAGIDSYSVD